MRLAAVAIASLVSTSAYAGGIGLLVNGGTHTDTVYYYSDHTYPDGDQSQAVPITDPKDYVQYKDNQTGYQTGAGFEFILGNRSDDIHGLFRFYGMIDGPQGDPSKGSTSVRPEDVVSNYRDKSRAVGMGLVGLSWTFVGPQAARFGAAVHIGSGFLTTDHTEFFVADIGPTASFTLARTVTAFVDVGYQTRYRKTFTHGVNATAGIRYMFD